MTCLAAAGHAMAYSPGDTSPQHCSRHTLGKAAVAGAAAAAAGAAAADCNTLLPQASDVHSAALPGFDACNSPGVMNLVKKSAGSSAGCHGNHTSRERTAWPGLVIYREKEKERREDSNEWICLAYPLPVFLLSC